MLHEGGFASTRFHDFETASKSMQFGRVYTEPFSPENPSRDGIKVGRHEGSCCRDMLQRHVAATKRCVVHTEATCIRVV